MAKFRFYASLGYANADREEIVEIPDEVLEDLTDEEVEELVQEEFDGWLANYSDFGFHKVDEGAGE